MKKSELKKIIREEYKKTLTEVKMYSNCASAWDTTDKCTSDLVQWAKGVADSDGAQTIKADVIPAILAAVSAMKNIR